MATSDQLQSSVFSISLINQLQPEPQHMLIMDNVISSKRTIRPSLTEQPFTLGLTDEIYHVINVLQVDGVTFYTLEQSSTKEKSYISVDLFEKLFKPEGV